MNGFTPLERLYIASSLAGTAVGAYHGYGRTRSVPWAIAWALLGGAFPFVTIPIAAYQGIGQPQRRAFAR